MKGRIKTADVLIKNGRIEKVLATDYDPRLKML